MSMGLSYHTQLLHLHILYRQLEFFGVWHVLRRIDAKDLGLRDTSSDASEVGPWGVPF